MERRTGVIFFHVILTGLKHSKTGFRKTYREETDRQTERERKRQGLIQSETETDRQRQTDT